MVEDRKGVWIKLSYELIETAKEMGTWNLLLYIFKVFDNKGLTALSSSPWMTAIISLQITMLCFFPCPLQSTDPTGASYLKDNSDYFSLLLRTLTEFPFLPVQTKTKVCTTAYKALYYLIPLLSFLSTNYSSLTLSASATGPSFFLRNTKTTHSFSDQINGMRTDR